VNLSHGEEYDDFRREVRAFVEANWNGGMQALSDWIGHNPEVGFKEFKAVDTLTKVLRAAGFTVDTGVAALHTAFVATWDSPAGTNGPTLGLIGEYDALRGTQGDFHGDQHNAQSPVAIAAALVARTCFLARNGDAGQPFGRAVDLALLGARDEIVMPPGSAGQHGRSKAVGFGLGRHSTGL